MAVATSRTLQALATAPGLAPSAVASATYLIGGDGAPLAALCGARLDRLAWLAEACLHACPAAVPGLLDRATTGCADRLAELDAGLVAYDADAGAACLAALRSLDCAGLAEQGGLVAPAACARVLAGLVPVGGRCWDGADCAGGSCTVDLDGGCPGTCQAWVALGGDCLHAACAPGLACGAGTCQVPSGPGGPCPCREGLACDWSARFPGACRAPLAAGEPCEQDGFPCALGTRCVGAPAACLADLAEGAGCDPDADACGPGLLCTGASLTCVPRPTVGQPCTWRCLDAWCDFDLAPPTCRALLADGAPCTILMAGLDCASGRCDPSTARCGPSAPGRCAMP